MNRTKIAFLFAAVFALTFTVEHASSAHSSPSAHSSKALLGPIPCKRSLVAILTVGGVSTGLGTERFTWDAIATRGPALSPRLATRGPAVGGTGGTNNPSVNLFSLSGLV